MARDYAVLMGATGWMHPKWQTEYYPEGLPAEWQLGFYSNEFPVVMVTSREWQSDKTTDPGLPGCWLDDSEASFRFVVEIDAEHTNIKEWHVRLDAFGDRLIGVVLNFETLPAAKQLSALCLEWQNLYPLSVDFTEAVPGSDLIAVMRESNIGWCWRDAGRSEGLNYGTLSLARIETKNKTPRDLRSVIETMLNIKTTQQRLILFEGTPPSIEIIKNAGVIIDLL